MNAQLQIQIYRLLKQLFCAPMYILSSFVQPILIVQPRDHQLKTITLNIILMEHELERKEK